MMKILHAALLFLISSPALSNIGIPGASIQSGYDRVYSSSGTSCESSQEPDMYYQIGLTASKDDKTGLNNKIYGGNYERDEIGAYAQIVIPISDGRKRVDCSRLYDLEIQKLQAEILKLKLDNEFAGWERSELDSLPLVKQ